MSLKSVLKKIDPKLPIGRALGQVAAPVAGAAAAAIPIPGASAAAVGLVKTAVTKIQAGKPSAPAKSAPSISQTVSPSVAAEKKKSLKTLPELVNDNLFLVLAGLAILFGVYYFVLRK